MVLVVHGQNREAYARELDSMHRDRKTVFIDMHHWNLVATGEREYDQFDTGDAVYLIEADPISGQHVCSLRLLPTTGPHLLSDVFPQLCDAGVPRGEDVWEVTRICFAPSMRGRERRQMLKHITLAAAEFGLLYGIRRYSVMAYLSFLPEVLSLGWDSDPLGVPKQIDEREPVAAFTVDVTPEVLQLFRRQWEVSATVLQLSTPRAA